MLTEFLHTIVSRLPQRIDRHLNGAPHRRVRHNDLIVIVVSDAELGLASADALQLVQPTRS